MNQKNNIFEHILYEINMYLFTYDLFLTRFYEPEGDSDYLIVRNTILEAQFVHMRNVTDFFLNKASFSDDIVLDTVLEKSVSSQCQLNKANLVLKDNNGNALLNKNGNQIYCSEIINKSVAHLTGARFDSNMEFLQGRVIEIMIGLLFNCIKSFVDLLQTPTNVVPDYQNDLTNYQSQINHLRTLTLSYFSVKFGF